MAAKELIAQARAGLVVDEPFFATILLQTPISENKDIPTMATDGDTIMFNPEWVETLSLEEVTFVLAHEVMHIVFDHMGRRGDREPQKWNIAADYVINQTLVDEEVGIMPEIGLLDPALVKRGDGTTDGVYALLPDSASKKKTGQPGGPMDSVHDAGSEQGTQEPDQATVQRKSSEMRVRVIQAKNAAKMQGQLSAGLERLIGEVLKVRTDWRAVLRRFLTERAKVDYSFGRLKRRFLAEDICLPSLVGEKMGTIAVAIDCSGSVDQDTLSRFGGELNAIIEDLRPACVKLLYFDSEVLRQDTIAEGESVVLKAIGGGGTSFWPVFDAINEWPEPPIACVFLTDLYGDFGQPPDYPVLWATIGDTRAPFGEVVELGDE